MKYYAPIVIFAGDDGKETIIENNFDQFNDFNIPYPGTFIRINGKRYGIFNINLQHDTNIFTMYCCDTNDERFLNIQMLDIQIIWHDGIETTFLCPVEKYELGKKCFINMRDFFIMGEILKEGTMGELFFDGVNMSSVSHITCQH